MGELNQDVKIGDVGEAKFSESLAGEKAVAEVKVGSFLKLGITAEIDNHLLLEFVASKLPGGMAHEAVVMLEKALFPSA